MYNHHLILMDSTEVSCNWRYTQLLVILFHFHTSSRGLVKSYFTLIYLFRCQVIFFLFMYKLCLLFFVSYLLICLIPCNIFSFKMSIIEFSHVLLGRLLFSLPVIIPCYTFFTDPLLSILFLFMHFLQHWFYF